jgi:intraflagellar transport protein 80
MFNEDNPLLAAISDASMHLWYHPSAAFTDFDLMADLHQEASEGLKQGQISYFSGTQCIVRRSDGAVVNVPGISPYPIVLRELIRKKQWEDAVKLCRHIKVLN